MMTDNQRKTAAILALAEQFGHQLSEPTVVMILAALDDLRPDEVELACGLAMRQCQFWPPVAELRKLAGRYEGDIAIKAWMAVERAAEGCGSYRHVDFEDPLINAAIRSLGGWPLILARTGDDWAVWTRKAFIEAYDSLNRSGVTGDVCGPLSGLSEGEVVNGQVEWSVEPHKIGVDYPIPETSRKLLAERRQTAPARIENREPTRIGKVGMMAELAGTQD